METNKKLETKRIFIYLALTFTITYSFCFFVIYPLNTSDNVRSNLDSLTTLLIASIMFFPALGVLLTRLITKEGFKNAWLHPHFKGNIKTYLLAYFGPGVLTLLGTALHFIIFPDDFDSSFGFLNTMLESAGASADTYPMSLSTLILIQALTGLFFGPLMNFLTCFGEEWGWRGYLLPKMSEKLPLIPMLLVNGVIWGLWHAPITALGHNYGVGYPGFPFTGIAAMCVFCIVIGAFLSYVSLKTQSCIPAVLGHGAINSIAGIGLYMTKDGGNAFIGPAPTGIVGMLPFIIVGVILIIRYQSEKKKSDVQ
ncbi:MAG: CPBP family intramembrane metalloprotease [Lachnospiraceae bacterium]|nr:CPBP family intramembrane metalloprotease [Lachnospiraceae bacterium]